MDAARFLPFLGAFAFVIPTLWAGEARTVTGLAYLFAVWLLLIGLAFVIFRRVPVGEPDAATPEPREAPEDT